MVVGGVVARQSGQRFQVAMTVVDGDKVIADNLVHAPAGEPESRQLRALQVRAHELLRANRVEGLAFWTLDSGPSGIRLQPALTSGRAEGAVLAAAGELGIENVAMVSGAAIRSAGGGGGSDAAVKTLCKSVRNVPDGDDLRRATAVAIAAVARDAL